MKRPALTRLVPAALVLVLVMLSARGRWRSTTSDQQIQHGEININELHQRLADLGTLRCSVPGGHIALGERSTQPYGAVRDGRPEACATCTCTVTASDADPEPECVISDCPSHMCDKQNHYYFEPDHPCCAICNVTEPEPPTEPPRVIDTAIPLTSSVYERPLLHEPVSVCAPSDRLPPLALLGVTSRPGGSERRALFRRLYGADLAAARIRLVFVLGREVRVERGVNQLLADEEEYEDYEPEVLEPAELEQEATRHAQLQEAVDAEAERYGDILQTRTAEHYNHLSLKTLALLDFAGRHCQQAAFVVKTDDDVLVTVRRLREELEARAGAAREPSIHGHLCVACLPSRGRLVWRSSHREWPWDRYPDFVTGPGYLVSAGAVRPLVEHALRTRYHHLEDVFLTGIVAQAAGVRRHQWDAQCTNRVHGGDLCALSHCALSHSDRYEDGGQRMDAFAYAVRRFDVDSLCASNVTLVDA